ncbi:hypothetical protein QZH41_004592 [Actinostola sp. cb2023]|nr:hypothetical protein QZH41_004592 [Actinostola sp. cb2023]
MAVPTFPCWYQRSRLMEVVSIFKITMNGWQDSQGEFDTSGWRDRSSIELMGQSSQNELPSVSPQDFGLSTSMPSTSGIGTADQSVAGGPIGRKPNTFRLSLQKGGAAKGKDEFRRKTLFVEFNDDEQAIPLSTAYLQLKNNEANVKDVARLTMEYLNMEELAITDVNGFEILDSQATREPPAQELAALQQDPDPVPPAPAPVAAQEPEPEQPVNQQNELDQLKKMLEDLRQLQDAGSVDSTLRHLRELARPAPLAHATMAALENLVDVEREKASAQASRYAIILRQTRSLDGPSLQPLLLKLLGSDEEVAISKEIQKALQAVAAAPRRPELRRVPGQYANDTRGATTCYFCGRRGHIMKDCFARRGRGRSGRGYNYNYSL